MAAKKAKSRKNTMTNTNPTEESSEKKIDRLELLSKAQDLEHMTTKVQALQVQLQKLQSDANMVNRQLSDFKADGERMAQQFVTELNAFKKKYNVPVDKEVNLRTGELVDPQPQEGQAPMEVSVEEAPQS